MVKCWKMSKQGVEFFVPIWEKNKIRYILICHYILRIILCEWNGDIEVLPLRVCPGRPNIRSTETECLFDEFWSRAFSIARNAALESWFRFSIRRSSLFKAWRNKWIGSWVWTTKLRIKIVMIQNKKEND